MSESADETDSKSVIRKGVWVRVPPPAPDLNRSQTLDLSGFAGFSLCSAPLCNAPPATANALFYGSFLGGTLEGHERYLEGYTPKIALADATFELKFRCV